MNRKVQAAITAVIAALALLLPAPPSQGQVQKNSPAPLQKPQSQFPDPHREAIPSKDPKGRIKDTCAGLTKEKLAQFRRQGKRAVICIKPGWDKSVKSPKKVSPRIGATAIPSWCGDDEWILKRREACVRGRNTARIMDSYSGTQVGHVNFIEYAYIRALNGPPATGRWVHELGAEVNPADPGSTVVTFPTAPPMTVQLYPGLGIDFTARCMATDGSCALVDDSLPRQPLQIGNQISGSLTFEFRPRQDRDILLEQPQIVSNFSHPMINFTDTEITNWSTHSIRCDNATPGAGKGCAFHAVRPIMEYSLSAGGENYYPELAKHIKDAQEGRGSNGEPLPGSPESGEPLSRVQNPRLGRNRGAACTTSWKRKNRKAGASCDEYPMASTFQGGLSRKYSVRMIDKNHNSEGGNALNDFYRLNRVIPPVPETSDNVPDQSVGDQFYIEVTGTCDQACQNPSPVLPGAALTGLSLGASNRRPAIQGLYDWSKAGYREGADLPSESDYNASDACQITAAEMTSVYQVIPNDGGDDTTGIQNAITNIKDGCSPTASYTSLSRITLPAGELNVTRQIYADANYLLIRGAGTDPDTGTSIIYQPDGNTRYDAITPDGTDWDEDGMISGSAKGGWIWPGRGLFRVQSRQRHPSYDAEWNAADPNRKDLFDGTINVHWKNGAKLREKPADTGYAARTGDTKIYLANNTNSTIMGYLAPGKYVNIRAANTMNFYQYMQALPTDHELLNQHMRQQIFKITGRGTSSTDKWITVDKPLEFDVPVNSTSDGSAPIPGLQAPYDSKAAPLVDPILGVGFEDLYFTQDMPGLDDEESFNNYGNMDPAAEMHGIVFKWAVNGWVKGIQADMVGSHPIVTEEAKNLSIINNHLDGSWNKGKGGNGYFRGSRVWDSVYAGNTLRNLRHFTFQWSASGNVAIGNSTDSDLNLHGGWERNNLFELNQVVVSSTHRPSSCHANCGDEGHNDPDDSEWFPIWWAAGKKAVKWSGASGANNIFFNNTMKKQLGALNAPYINYYSDRNTIFRFGSDGYAWRHLSIGGIAIPNWAHNEQADYTNGNGVDDSMTHTSDSVFLNSVS